MIANEINIKYKHWIWKMSRDLIWYEEEAVDKRRETEKNGFHVLSSGVKVIIVILKNSKADTMTFITQNKHGV